MEADTETLRHLADWSRSKKRYCRSAGSVRITSKREGEWAVFGSVQPLAYSGYTFHHAQIHGGYVACHSEKGGIDRDTIQVQDMKLFGKLFPTPSKLSYIFPDF